MPVTASSAPDDMYLGTRSAVDKPRCYYALFLPRLTAVDVFTCIFFILFFLRTLTLRGVISTCGNHTKPLGVAVHRCLSFFVGHF
ncbi:hypothetical protein LY78DRAFT_425375 [Colletotrichum sublineola]|nr:hypothetical protein LY78DRAFT_425375 [Colletotrichum sublineola]